MTPPRENPMLDPVDSDRSLADRSTSSLLSGRRKSAVEMVDEITTSDLLGGDARSDGSASDTTVSANATSTKTDSTGTASTATRRLRVGRSSSSGLASSTTVDAVDVKTEEITADVLLGSAGTEAPAEEIDGFESLLDGGVVAPIETELEPELDRPVTPPVIVRPQRLRDRRRRRKYGVAPFVRPASRRSRRLRRRDYRRDGFIELTQEKLKRRHRILPRSVIGTSLMLLMLAAGGAFSGAVLYAYYDFRLTENEATIEALTTGIDTETDSAAARVNTVADAAIDDINRAIGPIQDSLNDQNALVDLPAQFADSVYTVRTQDLAGNSSVGTAFVVATDANSSLLLTSYEVVRAAFAEPRPDIVLTSGGRELIATAWSFDASRDMALLTVPQNGLPAIPFASNEVNSSAQGTKVFALSGLGATGASASPGLISDSNSEGLQHNASLSSHFRGAPLLTSSGEVMGLASLNYDPLNVGNGEVRFAPSIVMACGEVIKCSDRQLASGGTTAPGFDEPLEGDPIEDTTTTDETSTDDTSTDDTEG